MSASVPLLPEGSREAGELDSCRDATVNDLKWKQ